MENQEGKKRSFVQNALVEISGDITGWGAGTLVGGVALSAVEAISGLGKPMKVLLKLGAYGLSIATMYATRNATQQYVGDICDAVNGIKGLFAKKEPVVEQQGATVE